MPFTSFALPETPLLTTPRAEPTAIIVSTSKLKIYRHAANQGTYIPASRLNRHDWLRKEHI
jgi:hypothetical protein